MDEEEELDSTRIGQQEEEAPAVNTEGALMGNVNFRDYSVPEPPRTAALSVFTPSGDLKPGIDVNAITPSPTTLPAPSVVNTALPQESGQLPQALPALNAVATDQPQVAVSPFLQSPDTPSGLGGPLLRGFEMVNDAARGPNAPMGQEATRAALGGMTLNEYLNAPAGTPGVSGLRTDPQGRMVPNIAQFQAQPAVAQPAVDSGAPATTTQPPASALSDFERASLERQQRIGGTGSFAGDSAAREARLAERDRLPGETQTERDTRIAQSRTQGSRSGGGLSQADLRDLAQGSARGATEGEKARALQIQQRAGLGQFKPDMTPLQEQALRTRIEAQETAIGQSQAASADTDSFNTSISNSTSAGGAIDYNKALNEYVGGGGNNRGYLEFLRKGQELAQEAIDAGRKPQIKVIELDGFKVLTQDDKYMTATTIGGEELSTSAIRTLQGKIELIEDAEKDYFSGDPERKRRAERTITALNIKNDFGGQLTAKDYFEPDAVNQNDNSGTGNDQTPNPNTLTPEQRQAFRDQYNIN